MQRALGETMFFRLKLFYVRITSDWMTVVYVNKHRRYEDIPQIAIDAGHKVIGLGRDAERAMREAGPDSELLNGFKHPRMVIADFLAAQVTLMMFMQQTQNWFERMLPPMPTMLIHPYVPFEDGLTEVEGRALSDLGMAVGARRVHLCNEPTELSEEQLAQLTSRVLHRETGDVIAHNAWKPRQFP